MSQLFFLPGAFFARRRTLTDRESVSCCINLRRQNVTKYKQTILEFVLVRCRRSLRPREVFKYSKSFDNQRQTTALFSFFWIKGAAERGAAARRRPNGTVTCTAMSAPKGVRGITAYTQSAGRGIDSHHGCHPLPMTSMCAYSKSESVME